MYIYCLCWSAGSSLLGTATTPLYILDIEVNSYVEIREKVNKYELEVILGRAK